MTDEEHELFEWYASQKELKWGVRVLRVRGRCWMPPGYSAELRRLSPQGINPRARVLVLHLHKALWRRGLSGPMTVKEIDYKEITGSVFETVLIMPDGVEIRVQPG